MEKNVEIMNRNARAMHVAMHELAMENHSIMLVRIIICLAFFIQKCLMMQVKSKMNMVTDEFKISTISFH